jgi:hypothetical protein
MEREMDRYYLLMLGAAALPAVWVLVTWLEAHAFRRKLYGLGHLSGRSKDEIIVAIGMPSSFSKIDVDKELLQWQRPGYHIALMFEGGVCQGATHEYKAY